MARKPTSGQQEKIQRVLPGHETQGQTSTDSGTSSGGKSGTGDFKPTGTNTEGVVSEYTVEDVEAVSGTTTEETLNDAVTADDPTAVLVSAEGDNYYSLARFYRTTITDLGGQGGPVDENVEHLFSDMHNVRRISFRSMTDAFVDELETENVNFTFLHRGASTSTTIDRLPYDKFSIQSITEGMDLDSEIDPLEGAEALYDLQNSDTKDEVLSNSIESFFSSVVKTDDAVDLRLVQNRKVSDKPQEKLKVLKRNQGDIEEQTITDITSQGLFTSTNRSGY